MSAVGRSCSDLIARLNPRPAHQGTTASDAAHQDLAEFLSTLIVISERHRVHKIVAATAACAFVTGGGRCVEPLAAPIGHSQTSEGTRGCSLAPYPGSALA